MTVAKALRDGDSGVTPWDAWTAALYAVCAHSVTVSTGFGAAYLYESVKDAAKWMGFSPIARHAMSVGQLLYVEREKFDAAWEDSLSDEELRRYASKNQANGNKNG